MKKIIVSIFAIFACLTLSAERVAQEDAAVVANNFINLASGSSAVKKAPAKKMVLKQAATAEENMYYVYENTEGEGWVIVAANDAVSPILAYSETGHFRTDNMPVNVRKWMGKYNHFIQKIEVDGVAADEETTAEWSALRKGARRAKGDAVVGPLIQTTWDQDDPYWDQCPGTGKSKAYTGCVATAMAQVMKYWEWPVKGTGSHTYQPLDPNSETGAKSKRYGKQTANFGETTYDWANMKNSYNGNYTDAEASAVATLMFHCGVATEMMYGNDADGGSGTYTVNYGDWTDPGCAQNAFFTYFGYKKPTGYMRDGYSYGGTRYYVKWTDEDWTAMIKEELDKHHPIMYGGASDQGGHSFICDGYDNDNYFHFNWGWSGENDGYYKLSNLKPGSGGAGGGGYDFSEDQDVIIGIVPDKKDLPKVTITWSVNGVETTTEFTQEDLLVLPDNPSDCSEELVFVGWTTNKEVKGEMPKDLFTTATGKVVSEPITYYAVFAIRSGEGASEVEDKLTPAIIDVTGTAYDMWDNIKCTSDAVYAGNSAGGNSAIQLRSKNGNSGIVSTTSGGRILKVNVEWNESTLDQRTLNIYGSNDAYTDVTNLYGHNRGTKLGSIIKGVDSELGIVDDYKYVGVRSDNGVIYINSITFTWGGSNVTFSGYTTTCDGGQAIEHVDAEERTTKRIENGQIIIIRDNEKYTILGQKIN